MKSEEYTKCLRCGRKLKNPEARKIGYGKICLEKSKNYKKNVKLLFNKVSNEKGKEIN